MNINWKNVINLFQGYLGFLLFFAFKNEGRTMGIVILTLLFFTSLIAISLRMGRRRNVVEIFEILIYYLFFGLSFLGVNDLKDINLPHPRPNYLLVPICIAITFNWGEWISRIILRITYSEEKD